MTNIKLVTSANQWSVFYFLSVKIKQRKSQTVTGEVDDCFSLELSRTADSNDSQPEEENFW